MCYVAAPDLFGNHIITQQKYAKLWQSLLLAFHLGNRMEKILGIRMESWYMEHIMQLLIREMKMC